MLLGNKAFGARPVLLHPIQLLFRHNFTRQLTRYHFA
jgi:hypothetical protein